MSPIDPYQAPTTTTESNVGGSGKLSAKAVLFSFNGRIPRSTYWIYSLLMSAVFYAIILPLVIIDADESLVGGVMLIMYIPAIWVGFALAVKRWHDRDKSGWWILISFIPLVGPIWAFVENGCLAGTDGPNSYGNDPRQ